MDVRYGESIGPKQTNRTEKIRSSNGRASEQANRMNYHLMFHEEEEEKKKEEIPEATTKGDDGAKGSSEKEEEEKAYEIIRIVRRRKSTRKRTMTIDIVNTMGPKKRREHDEEMRTLRIRLGEYADRISELEDEIAKMRSPPSQNKGSESSNGRMDERIE